MTDLTMATNIFTLSSDALPPDAEVVGFRGHEALSEPYRFEIGFLTSDPTFSEDDAVMARATLAFRLGYKAAPYRYHGVLASVELVHSFLGKSLYRVVLVPKLWQLEVTRHSNVWTDVAIPQILADVLEWSGLGSDEFSLQLEQEYPVREFVAQYKESNLAFLHRWMERLGMAYYFEQGEERERLVVIDGPQDEASGGPGGVKYRPLSEGDFMALESFEWVRSKSRALPSTVKLHDYDYMKPTLEVRGLSKLGKAKLGTVSRFADDHFATPVEGDMLAKIRVEALQAQQKVLHARGRVFHLHAGRMFSLEDHPRGELNRKYLAVAVTHEGNQAAALPEVKEALGLEIDKEYICEVTAIPSDVVYRTPTDRTPWPRIASYESAVICGEAASPYAQIDDEGRYKVRILFDESDLGDGRASAWVRQQQPYGGTTEGFHFPLLKGTEVTLIFLGGDPDRPVIAGVVPNTQTPSPVVAKNHTQNVIQTVNKNLIQIEDKLGEQSVYVYCPIETSWMHLGVLKEGFNAVLSSTGHGHFDFGGHQVVDVALSLTENVKGDVTNNYLANYMHNVVGNSVIETLGTKSQHVVGDVHYDYDALWKSTVLGDMVSDISGVKTLHVVGDVTETFDANRKTDIASNNTETIGGTSTETVMGDHKLTVNASQTREVKGPVVESFQAKFDQSIFGVTIQNFWSFQAKFNGGAVSETFVGLKNANHFGAKIDTVFGLEAKMKYAVSIDATMGFKIDLAPALEMDLKGTKIKAASTFLEAIAGPSVLFAGIQLENAGLTVIS
ncbi:MAG: type VI secretion system tip protein VgrG [Deltaproteobacteria bacterium]|nr:type VI secretion system tip protein VgrG [Deltaproteobacteria bacterium]